MGSFDLVLRWKKQCILACIGEIFSEWNWSHKMSTNVCLAIFFGKSFFQNVSNTQERQQEPSSWPLASFSKAVKKLSLTRQAKFHPTCSPLCAILRQHKGTWNCRMLRQSAGKGMRFCGTGSTSYCHCQPHNVRDKWDLNNWIQLNRLLGSRMIQNTAPAHCLHWQFRPRPILQNRAWDLSETKTFISPRQNAGSFDTGNSVRHTTRAGSTKPTILRQPGDQQMAAIGSYDQLKVRIARIYSAYISGCEPHRRTSEFQAASGLQQLASPAQELLPLPCCRSLPCGLQLRKGTWFIHHEMLLNCDFVKYKKSIDHIKS